MGVQQPILAIYHPVATGDHHCFIVRLEHGDLLFHRFMDPDPRELVGKLVVAKLKDGRRFVKVLLAGTRRGRFTLASLNPSFAPMEDQAIEAVARIVWVKKRN